MPFLEPATRYFWLHARNDDPNLKYKHELSRSDYQGFFLCMTLEVSLLVQVIHQCDWFFYDSDTFVASFALLRFPFDPVDGRTGKHGGHAKEC